MKHVTIRQVDSEVAIGVCLTKSHEFEPHAPLRKRRVTGYRRRGQVRLLGPLSMPSELFDGRVDARADGDIRMGDGSGTDGAESTVATQMILVVVRVDHHDGDRVRASLGNSQDRVRRIPALRVHQDETQHGFHHEHIAPGVTVDHVNTVDQCLDRQLGKILGPDRRRAESKENRDRQGCVGVASLVHHGLSKGYRGCLVVNRVPSRFS